MVSTFIITPLVQASQTSPSKATPSQEIHKMALISTLDTIQPPQTSASMATPSFSFVDMVFPLKVQFEADESY